MVYVMADLHGQYDQYREMLEKIRFSGSDSLYILGDVIDRGRRGLDILRDMMLRANVYPILGNHEYMASLSIPWLMQEVSEENLHALNAEMLRGVTEWMRVGGSATADAFRMLDRETQEDILDYLSEFSLSEEVSVNGQSYLLVHAGLANFSPARPLENYDLSELLFQSPDMSREYFPDRFLVTGHTPTRIYHAAAQGKAFSTLSQSEYTDRIFRRNRHIAIDCGAAFGGRLACLCLDTQDEFYV